MRDSSWAQEHETPWEETLALMITEIPGISESRTQVRLSPSLSGAYRSIMSPSLWEAVDPEPHKDWFLPRTPQPFQDRY